MIFFIVVSFSRSSNSRWMSTRRYNRFGSRGPLAHFSCCTMRTSRDATPSTHIALGGIGQRCTVARDASCVKLGRAANRGLQSRERSFESYEFWSKGESRRVSARNISRSIPAWRSVLTQKADPTDSTGWTRAAFNFFTESGRNIL